jgi:hypothetical protein
MLLKKSGLTLEMYFRLGAPAFMRGTVRFSAPGKLGLGLRALAPATGKPGAKSPL